MENSIKTNKRRKYWRVAGGILVVIGFVMFIHEIYILPFPAPDNLVSSASVINSSGSTVWEVKGDVFSLRINNGQVDALPTLGTSVSYTMQDGESLKMTPYFMTVSEKQIQGMSSSLIVAGLTAVVFGAFILIVMSHFFPISPIESARKPLQHKSL